MSSSNKIVKMPGPSRHCVLVLLLSLLLSVNARPSDLAQRIDIQDTSNQSNPIIPTFEQLAHTGWQKMRLPYPFTSLKTISAVPLRDAPSATRLRDFRHIIMLGQDTRSGKWLHIDNLDGKNQWNIVQQVRNPPPVVTNLPSFRLEQFPISFSDAWDRVREAGLSRPWAEVRLSAEEFPALPDTGVSYVFMEPGFRHGQLVDVGDGSIHPIIPPSTDDAGITSDTTYDLWNQTSAYSVEATQ